MIFEYSIEKNNNMKKLILTGIVAVLSLVSCKKDYICSFKYDQSGEEKVVSYDCNDCTKNDIKDREAESVEYNGENYKYTCTTK